MSGPLELDGRRARDIDTELRRRALAVLSGDGRSPPLGPVTEAILAVAARIEEEVTRRIDMAPAKQADNFYNAAGIGRDPARAASLPVAFALAEGAKAVLSAPARTQLMVDADGPVIFETATRIDLAPGTIAALRGLDAEADAIAIPSAAVMAATLPRLAPTPRRLRGGAAAGAAKIQVDPVAGLQPGTLLQLGAGDSVRQYLAVAVEGDLVTLEPALETPLPENSPAVEVTDFSPFTASARNHQSHALYLGHAKLLDIPSAVTIAVTGTALPADAIWSWWGQLGDDDPPAWQALTPNDGATLSFTKAKGKPVKKKIGARESLWLRAELPGKSLASARAQDVRIAIGDVGLCTSKRDTRCKENLAAMSVGYEAIANTTPIVTNRAFHPFGREPRLYDSFYIGSNEAFSKSGAEISLCFEFGGADLGPLAVVSDALGAQVFAIGAGGVAYRADFRAGAATLMPLPPPPDPALLSQAAIDARCMNGQILVAAASTGAVHVATFAIDSKLDPASVKWTRLETQAPQRPIRQIAIAQWLPGLPVPTPIVYALEKADSTGPGRLWRWDGLGEGSPARLVSRNVADLILAQESGAPEERAVLWIEESDLGHRITLHGDTAVNPWLDAPDFPARCRTAWRGPAGATDFLYIAGNGGATDDGLLRLLKYKPGAAALADQWQSAKPVEALPATFTLTTSTPTAPVEQRLQLSIARESPRHFHIAQGRLAGVDEPNPIGAAPNGARMLVTSAGAGKTFVQRSNAGLLYRAAAANGVALAEEQVEIKAALYVAATAQVPAEPVYFTFGAAAPQGTGYQFADGEGDYRQLERLTPASQAGPDAGAPRFFKVAAPPADAFKASAYQIRLESAPSDPAITVLLLRKDAQGRRFAEGIWALELVPAAKSKPSATGKPAPAAPTSTKWKSTQRLPDADAGEMLEYELLETAPAVALIQALQLAAPGALTELLRAGPLFAPTDPPTQVTEPIKLGSAEILLLDHSLVEDKIVRLLRQPEAWRDLGPSQPANPALSWEYWNGESWWALAARELVDQTADFQQSGGVFFTVPADIAPTEVAGRNEHWLRVRLAGGDYGEAKVTVMSQPGTAPNTTEQVVVRDVGTVRAPYITSLKLGYCALDPVRPEIVLTEDSLGAVDQTSANEAGLEFPVFTPIAELMNPVSAAEASAKAASDDRSCDDPCPPPASSGPSPCAPGAYDRCDSPCIAPPGTRRPTGAAGDTGFVRGLMIGFSRPFAGETVSLYIDADPSGSPVELVADLLRNGRFTPVNLVADGSHGLTESGILTLAFPGPPDASDLFDASAYWLRLRPKGDSSRWSPRLRGVHLNGVLARSIETRTMEPLGQSIGVAGQVFQLTEAPVDPNSLEIRVRELLADEDKADPGLDIQTYAAGPAGDWVRWKTVDDLAGTGAPGRVFVVDAEAGLIRFGDGATGRIPPLGADIIAAHYAHLTGRKANGVAPGKQLQTLSPLAGVEKVVALDNAAGGSDAEPLESARRRAAAKVRHGGRILTRADLEDYAPTLSPGIAQVRAEKKGGGMRLVVAMAGAEARPSPAQLREFAAAIGEVSGYGLARPGGLNVVAPRLLPLAVGLVLRPLAPDLFAEAAEQAKAALAALFDPATGYHDGKGWPLGRLPDAQDIAAALTAIEALALPETVTLERADKEIAVERALPAAIPSDVLVRLDSVGFDRAREEAA